MCLQLTETVRKYKGRIDRTGLSIITIEIATDKRQWGNRPYGKQVMIQREPGHDKEENQPWKTPVYSPVNYATLSVTKKNFRHPVCRIELPLPDRIATSPDSDDIVPPPPQWNRIKPSNTDTYLLVHHNF